MAYLKVYSRTEAPRAIVHHTIEFFQPGTLEEAEAYARGADAMRAHPGARWATSELCHGACSSLPVVADTRAYEAIRSKHRGTIADRENMKLLYVGAALAPEVALELAILGFASETFPGTFTLSDAGEYAIGMKPPSTVAVAA